MSHTISDDEVTLYIDAARNEAAHAFDFLRESGTLSASLIFHVSHRIPGQDKLLTLRFPQPWERDKTPRIDISRFSDRPESLLHEARLEADTLIHAHTPYLAAWSLAHKSFPILYVAAQRHLLAREIPNHLERTRSSLEVVRERLDARPDLAPPPALLESNGGANFWGKGIAKTAELILLIEEAARFQAIAAQIGGAQVYTPGAIELQWRRTGLLERASQYAAA
ncbi:class II aldolase/adducin family protein [Paraburkholderia lycopersici]|uniref:Class II Aldolase and Adducin N-terminal domain-containing protein n=1 Tax=Paraburkholderia lycopersici TaxID=416944 RepID=A0A1G6HA98_9BURK|nr:class II aldolase/adducin family protein [Paraburkholderia lycopersici]SDB91141.1 Class II Aldolase and Adducin N-terminal domain-containing protein [Paraburkholderia lycopersici]